MPAAELTDDQARDAETDLIERAKRGDLMAYEDLVRRYQAVALRTASLFVPDPDDVQDVVQDALVKAHAALSRFRSGAPFRPWVLRIVANEARNRRRFSRRQAGLALRLAEDRRAADAAPSPEAAVLVHERRATLLSALARLGDADRQVLGFRYLLDLPEAEAAAAIGVPVGTVKSRASRALVRLRQALADLEAGR